MGNWFWFYSSVGNILYPYYFYFGQRCESLLSSISTQLHPWAKNRQIHNVFIDVTKFSINGWKLNSKLFPTPWIIFCCDTRLSDYVMNCLIVKYILYLLSETLCSNVFVLSSSVIIITSHIQNLHNSLKRMTVSSPLLVATHSHPFLKQKKKYSGQTAADTLKGLISSLPHLYFRLWLIKFKHWLTLISTFGNK